MTLGVRPISIEIPTELYQRLEKVAHFSGVSIETAFLQAGNWLHITELPIDRQKVLAGLADLSVVQLWAIVYQRLPQEDAQLLDELAEKNTKGLLTAAESLLLAELVALVDFQMVLRSQALVLLKKHGQDIDQYTHWDVEE